MQQSKLPVGILLIATRKYKQFVEPLLEQIENHFLKDYRLKVFLFTDNTTYFQSAVESVNAGRIEIIFHKIESYKFPEVTLLRYKIFSDFGDIYQGCGHLFYMDVDMAVVDTVGPEILRPVVAVMHPGFYRGGGSWGNNSNSLSYTHPDKRKRYYAGGFQGGSKDHYWAILNLLKNRIDQDNQKGPEAMAEWHDETHWNWFLAQNPEFTELTPEYCMVEQQHLRQEWGIDHFSPKIVALAKNHEEIRN